ncbi:MAG: sigma-70 family RNA polymerase sigma factor [Clostridia bacterium]|nr:sigma-70 family RNA polymerase sigma factor [Clostridia bacterium]
MIACEQRNIVVCENIGLVHACAKRFHGRGIEYDDLYQAGCVGLIKAVDGFEAQRGLKFSTYAVPVILGEIKRLFREGGTVKISRSLKELSLRATRERERLAKALGREPSIEELAEALQVDAALAAQAVTASLPPLSLTRRGEEEDTEQIDLPIDSPEAAITDRLALRQLLDELEERDRRLIELRYGARRTQQATAAQLGMTQVQVSRRERAILLSLREKLIG